MGSKTTKLYFSLSIFLILNNSWLISTSKEYFYFFENKINISTSLLLLVGERLRKDAYEFVFYKCL